MNFKNLNRQPDYIKECIENNYTLLFRVRSEITNEISYITGNIVKINLEMLLPTIITIRIHDNGYNINQQDILLNLHHRLVDVLNLDEIL